jgi:hypothetical protein
MLIVIYLMEHRALMKKLEKVPKELKVVCNPIGGTMI